MARVVVVGAGFAGLSVALRLARLRHDVVLLEQDATPGGRLRRRELDGFSWDLHSPSTTLPAVLRDLFRKTGRPLEDVLDLRHQVPGRRHVFADRTVLDLPMGGRGDQLDALRATLGDDGGWTSWVDDLGPVWEVLRTRVLERPFAGNADLDRAQRRTLRPRRVVRTEARRTFSDHRLRAMLLDHARVHGQSTRATPAFTLAAHHVERAFGRWAVDGGNPALLAALVARLDERGVDLRTSTRAYDVALGDPDDAGRSTVVGVDLGARVEPADLVVWAAPTQPESLPPAPGLPVIPLSVTHLGLRDRVPELPLDTVVHGNPVVTVHTGGDAPVGHRAWTLEHQGAGAGEDVLATLARRGIDVRADVATRVDLAPRDLVVAHGAAFGWQWQGWRSLTAVPGVPRPGAVAGLHVVGAATHPGPSLEAVGLGTAAVADLVGRA